MRILMFMAVALLCVSCSVTDIKESKASSRPALGAQGFIGEWTRGEPGGNGNFSERLVVDADTVRLFEDGILVLTGTTIIKDGQLIIEPDMNNSKYYRNPGGCRGLLSNGNMSLDLFGKVKGQLCFDRRNTEESPKAAR